MLVVNDHPDQKQIVTFDLPGNWNDVSGFNVSLVNKDRLNESVGSVSVKDGKIKLQCKPFSLLGLKA
jgi:GH18 family chitinase